jgi:hypothetical protein
MSAKPLSESIELIRFAGTMAAVCFILLQINGAKVGIIIKNSNLVLKY